MGFNWALLRFGPLVKSQIGKKTLYSFSLKIGTIFNFALVGIVLVFYYLFGNLDLYIFIFLIYLITNFQLELLKSYYRVVNRNKVYSKITSYQSLSLLIFTFILSYFLDGLGYALAYVLSTILPFWLFFKREKAQNLKLDVNRTEYIKYGLVTGVGMVANQVMITAGPILADFYGADPSEIASLKVSTILSFNLLIIPFLIMTTDFVYISKNYKNKHLLKSYYFGYVKSVFKLTIIPMLILFFFNKEIFILLFSDKYLDAVSFNLVLLFAVYFSIFLRAPLGNMLSALGKSNWNFIHTLFWFILFVPMSYFLFEYFGTIGLVYSIAIVFFLSGFISAFLFRKYLRSL